MTSTSWIWLEAEPRAKFAGPPAGPGPASPPNPLVTVLCRHLCNRTFVFTPLHFQDNAKMCDNVADVPIVNL